MVLPVVQEHAYMTTNRNFRSVREHLAERDLTNRKPFRTTAQQAAAKATARNVAGRWVSTAPRSFHHKREGA